MRVVFAWLDSPASDPYWTAAASSIITLWLVLAIRKITKRIGMKTGTKSILFGVHQFIWHPITVLLAWRSIFRRWPTWKELVCIVIHDWGYWGCPNMDGAEGERHPELGFKIALELFDADHAYLCLYHSRHYARRAGAEASRLCWADKLSIVYDPWWFYLPRAWLSGELLEYRREAAKVGLLPITATHREWFAWARNYLAMLGREKRGDVIRVRSEA